MIRWLFRIYFSAVALIAVLPIAMCAAPYIEGAAYPIVFHTVAPESVTRLPDNRLCWRVHLAKIRQATPWNLDVFLDRPWRKDRSFPEIADRWTKVALHTASALRSGETRDQDQCIELPDDLAPGEPVTLSQIVHYHGYRGWWDVTVELLSISYTVPGEPAHDTSPTPLSAPDPSEAPQP